MTRPTITRAFALTDYEVSRSGDGNTVTAYAATFADPYEVRDQHGHYMESINPTAWNQFLGRGGAARVGVYFNHAMTPLGTPSDRWSVPVGVPLEIKPDGKGLLTVTRYGADDESQLVLEMWRDGRIKGQSFSGPVVNSAPPRRFGNGLDLVERTVLGLREYGPTPSPVNHGAELVAIRSDLLTVDPTTLTAEEREHLLAVLQEPGPLSPLANGDQVEEPPPAEKPTAPVASDPATDPARLRLSLKRL